MQLNRNLTSLLWCALFIGNGFNAFAETDSWKENWTGGDKIFLSEGRNPYFVLVPGYELVLKGKEDGKKVDLVNTVLDEIKKIDGVETRVVEERENQDGKLAEV